MTARLAPVPDSLRFGQSNGAKQLEALRFQVEWLDSVRRYSRMRVVIRYGSWSAYEAKCSAVHARLREQANYLIQSGVR